MSTPEELIHLHKKCEPLSLYFVAVTKVYPIAGQLQESAEYFERHKNSADPLFGYKRSKAGQLVPFAEGRVLD